MLVLVIVAIVVSAVMTGLYTYCIGKAIAETLEMRKIGKQINKRWKETGKIFGD
jgi:uncharacterized membrane protein (DUF106 family)